MNTIIFYVINIYVDNITGVDKKPWYYLIKPSYWNFHPIFLPPYIPEYYSQEQRLKSSNSTYFNVIRCEDLSKTFRSLSLFPYPKYKSNDALKNVNLVIKDSTVFCLLGHNGVC